MRPKSVRPDAGKCVVRRRGGVPRTRLICYVVYDRNENVIYQNTLSARRHEQCGLVGPARCAARARRAPHLRGHQLSARTSCS